MIFLYFMGSFINIIKYHDTYNLEINEQAEQLLKFFSMLRKFNKDSELNLETKRQMEAYFDYRWEQDRNFMFVSEKYLNMSEQVPIIVIEKIYEQYLFKDFLKTYKNYFDFRKPSKHLHSRYTWYD